MIGIGAIAFTELKRIDAEATSSEVDPLPGFSLTGQMLAAWHENFSVTQEIVFRHDSKEFEELKDELDANKSKLNDLIQSLSKIIVSDAERPLVQELQKLVGTYENIQSQIV